MRFDYWPTEKQVALKAPLSGENNRILTVSGTGRGISGLIRALTCFQKKQPVISLTAQ